MSKEIKDIELPATINVDIDSVEASQSISLNLQPLTEKYDQLIQLKKVLPKMLKVGVVKMQMLLRTFLQMVWKNIVKI